MRSTISLSFIGIFSILILLSLSACKGGYSTAQKVPPPPAESMLELLKREPNLQVYGSGANVEIEMRGQTSITRSNNPMFLIDGRRVGDQYSSIAFINPQDVQRINVIRDPADLASYGVGAANGVIDVILKK